tara:strand:- start:799 stop:1110 length:312 start_codon:yes stop_codon:yes gene_type:complete
MLHFEKFIGDGLRAALATVGELATIGAKTVTASFDESEMSVSQNVYGADDEVTTTMTVIKSDLAGRPAIGSVLTRLSSSTVYVVLTVQEDVKSYEVGLRAKHG